jgi:hypothetical protein
MLTFALLSCGYKQSLSHKTYSRALLKRSHIALKMADNTASTGILDDEVDAEPPSKPADNNRKIIWSAEAKSSVRVQEIKRTAEEYMALPASQYSVLSADQVTRLSDTEFKYSLGSLNFFGTSISPVLYVDVNVYPDECKSEIIVERAEISGSELANKINGSFAVYAKNIVSAGKDDKGRKILTSDSKLTVKVTVPPSRFPLQVIQNGGNFIMQSTLSLLVATFIRILAADFKRWSSGDDSRSAVEGAKLST